MKSSQYEHLQTLAEALRVERLLNVAQKSGVRAVTPLVEVGGDGTQAALHYHLSELLQDTIELPYYGD
jgi:hypothetical protein